MGNTHRGMLVVGHERVELRGSGLMCERKLVKSK